MGELGPREQADARANCCAGDGLALAVGTGEGEGLERSRYHAPCRVAPPASSQGTTPDCAMHVRAPSSRSRWPAKAREGRACRDS
eukprot:2703335-Pyramimonas_sp.AAC.1